MKKYLVHTCYGIATLVFVSFALIGLTRTPANAEKPIIWRLNSNFAPTSLKAEAYRWLVESVERRTNGRLIIKPYFSASIGFKTDAGLTALKNGLIELNEIVGGTTMGSEPITSFGGLPFMFPDIYTAAWWRVNKLWPAYNRVLEQKGWKCRVVAEVQDPPIMFFSKKPLRSFEDFQGVKVRTWGGITMDALKIIGMNPFSISTSELYSALQRGMVEASITSYNSATEAHFWEVLEYVNKTILSYQQSWLYMSTNAYDALPSDIQEELNRCLVDFENLGCRRLLVDTYTLEKILTDHGMKVIYPEPGITGKMAKMCKEAGLYRKFGDQAGPEAIELLKELDLY